MATAGNLSGKLEGGHETFSDFACSLCEKEGKRVDAAKYCEECFVYMCDSCVRTHNRFPLNSKHKLLDQSQFTTLSQPALKSFPTKRCLKHPGELINIFCEDHDVVCCSVCKALDHSTCTKTQNLPEAAKGVLLSKEFQNIKKEAKTFLSDVNSVLANRSADILCIAKEKDNIKQTIANFRKKVNKYFDTLERKSLDELDLREKRITTIIDQDMKFLRTTKTKAKNILKQMERFKGDNECELFVQVKNGKNFVHDNMENVQHILKSEREESIKFIIHREIEVFLSTIDTLGTFSKTRLASASSKTRVVVPKKSPVSQTKQADTVTSGPELTLLNAIKSG
ncbi:probable E3 ubiquitin-protein ligase MID2 [Mercenaria mercenaria]|uniref:probable E3 ubiquitin-protein ligase MID2 n=1 Tax=Mercenaria mercenaria TaxID=6596 RepID=UPI00234E6CB1|nr:probable E3 ubiquitin-protein ligase MID2 [Mercenaria mercenaria]